MKNDSVNKKAVIVSVIAIFLSLFLLFSFWIVGLHFHYKEDGNFEVTILNYFLTAVTSIAFLYIAWSNFRVCVRLNTPTIPL
jgi:hypothetical protein